jgi:hypothetical protein
MGGLSEIDSRAPCYPAFSLVVLLRKSYRDGVNLGHLLRWPTATAGGTLQSTGTSTTMTPP